MLNLIPYMAQDRRFIDWKKVRVCGGKGGDGIASFKWYYTSVESLGWFEPPKRVLYEVKFFSV